MLWCAHIKVSTAWHGSTTARTLCVRVSLKTWHHVFHTNSPKTLIFVCHTWSVGSMECGAGSCDDAVRTPHPSRSPRARRRVAVVADKRGWWRSVVCRPTPSGAGLSGRPSVPRRSPTPPTPLSPPTPFITCADRRARHGRARPLSPTRSWTASATDDRPPSSLRCVCEYMVGTPAG